MVFLIIKGLIMVPLFLRMLGAASYGNWLASGNVISMVGAFEGGFAILYMQRLATWYGEGNPEGFAREAASGALALALAAALITVLALSVTPFVPGWTRALPEIDHELKWAFVLGGLGSGISDLPVEHRCIFGAWQRPLIAGITRLGSRTLEVLLLYLALKRGYGLLSFGIASIGGATCGTVVGWMMVGRAWRRGKFPRARLARSLLGVYLRQAPPVIAGRSGATVLNNNEALLISNFVSPAAATVYVLTDRVYKLGHMLVGILSGSVIAGIAHLAAEDREGPRLRAVLGELLLLSSLGAAIYCGGGAALNATFVATLVGPQYFGGNGLNALLAVAAVLMVRASLMSNFLMAFGCTGLCGLTRHSWSWLYGCRCCSSACMRGDPRHARRHHCHDRRRESWRRHRSSGATPSSWCDRNGARHAGEGGRVYGGGHHGGDRAGAGDRHAVRVAFLRPGWVLDRECAGRRRPCA